MPRLQVSRQRETFRERKLAECEEKSIGGTGGYQHQNRRRHDLRCLNPVWYDLVQKHEGKLDGLSVVTQTEERKLWGDAEVQPRAKITVAPQEIRGVIADISVNVREAFTIMAPSSNGLGSRPLTPVIMGSSPCGVTIIWGQVSGS